MSQRRVKKQLSTLDNVASLTDQELREALKNFQQSPGPITDSTRNLYRKKLASLIDETSGDDVPQTVHEEDDDDDDDDTSDEDYNVQDEGSEEEEDEDDEEEEEDEDDEVDLIKELAEETKLSNVSTETENLSTSIIREPDAAPNRISRGILMLFISFFIAVFSFYLYSTNNQKILDTLKPFKNITRQLLVLLALSPIGYIVYRTVRFYKLRRDEEMQRVCDLVHDALELLQSPDNPKGLMPILHIRDTLLTPAERKTKKMTNLWKKAMKFIEEHESRVKVELVNIDGEDFRAWKWIGSKKLL